MNNKQSAAAFILFAVFVITALIINFAVEWSEWVKRLVLSVLLFILVLIYYIVTKGSNGGGENTTDGQSSDGNQ